jgi:hypothetical protein
MRPATLAQDLGPNHPVGPILKELDMLEIGWFGEAWPSGSRLELRLGREQLGATGGTSECALAFLMQ